MKQMVNKSPILIEKIKDLEAMITPEEMAKLRETYSVPEISEMLNAKKKTVDNFLTKYSLRKPYKVTAANETVQLAEKAPAKEKEPIVKLKPEYAAIVKERDNALAALSEARKELDEVKQAYYAECDKNSLLNNLLNEMEERLSTKASETVVVNDTQYENELRFADVYETQLLKRILQLKGEAV